MITTLLQAIINGILIGSFYALMGMGQNVIFGVMKIINFCQGELLMVGMYFSFVFFDTFGIDPYFSIPLVMLCLFGLGGLIQHSLITPSLGTKSFTNLLFLTVGFLALPCPFLPCPALPCPAAKHKAAAGQGTEKISCAHRPAAAVFMLFSSCPRRLPHW
ncbi:MAG: ABC transporter permease subunit [Oscillospiraceae bacterium]